MHRQVQDLMPRRMDQRPHAQLAAPSTCPHRVELSWRPLRL
jgi:hypothetical protein